MIRHKSGTRWSDDRDIRWHRVRSVSYTGRRQEAQVFWFGPQLVLTVSWFGPQNHRDDFLVWVSKPSARRFVGLLRKIDERMKTVWGHVSTSGGLLYRKVSRARVFSFASKLVKERRRVVHTTSLQRSRESEAKDGRFDGSGCSTTKIRQKYPF
jgi:hypothetical protein